MFRDHAGAGLMAPATGHALGEAAPQATAPSTAVDPIFAVIAEFREATAASPITVVRPDHFTGYRRRDSLMCLRLASAFWTPTALHNAVAFIKFIYESV
jgi:hypothetical protein